MNTKIIKFKMGQKSCSVFIGADLPDVSGLCGKSPALVVCDTNTRRLAQKITASREAPLCVLEAGESYKNWQSIEYILKSAKEVGLGRDGVFIAAGGGVVCDLCAFAASIYMRGAKLCLLPTTLLAMVDAATGGKTGIDLFERKNFAGTFYPAEKVFVCTSALDTLPFAELKSGFGEVIKSAVIGGWEDYLTGIDLRATPASVLLPFIQKSLELKIKIIKKDPFEIKGVRELLNLGHTFAHALESVAGLGNLRHGDAVAWGVSRAFRLGVKLKTTSAEREQKVLNILRKSGYESAAQHPAIKNYQEFLKILSDDKKKKENFLRFVVPDKHSARIAACKLQDIEVFLR